MKTITMTRCPVDTAVACAGAQAPTVMAGYSGVATREPWFTGPVVPAVDGTTVSTHVAARALDVVVIDQTAVPFTGVVYPHPGDPPG